MTVRTPELEAEQTFTLTQRRAFLRLTLAERRRRLAAQAERMIEHYQQASAIAERERWQGGDIVEP